MKKRSYLKLACLNLLCLALLATAADHTVTSNLDDGPGTLRALVAAAVSGDRILIPEGMVITLESQVSIGSRNLTLEGLGSGATIQGSGESRLIYYYGGAGRTLICHNLTFTNGMGLENEGGGAFYIGYCKSVTLSNCVVVNNSAPGKMGGAIYCQNNWAKIIAIDTVFKNNSAKTGGVLGGHWAYGYEFDNCLIEGNSADEDGGVVRMYLMTNDLDTASAGVFKSCIVTNNTANQGGVINSAIGTETFEDCLLIDNRTTSYGSVVYQALSGAKNVIFRRSRIIRNEGRGAGVIYANRGKIHMYDSLFEGNVDYPGNNYLNGGIMWGRSSNYTLVSNCVFKSNAALNLGSATGNGNNGVFCIWEDAAGFEIIDSTFDSNYAENSTGVLRIRGGTNLVQNCTFKNNSSGDDDGAVVYVHSDKVSATSQTTFNNCTFYNNTAGIDGGTARRGVIYITGSYNPVEINHCTFVGNRADYAAVFHNSTTVPQVTMRNTVLADNREHNDTLRDVRGAFEVIENCAMNSSAAHYTALAEGSYSDNYFNCTAEDLKLLPLADNDSLVEHLDGTFLQTIAFETRSLLRDKAGFTAGLLTDARGYPRADPNTGKPDIGAYEFAPVTGTLLLVN